MCKNSTCSIVLQLHNLIYGYYFPHTCRVSSISPPLAVHIALSHFYHLICSPPLFLSLDYGNTQYQQTPTYQGYPTSYTLPARSRSPGTPPLQELTTSQDQTSDTTTTTTTATATTAATASAANTTTSSSAAPGPVGRKHQRSDDDLGDSGNVGGKRVQSDGGVGASKSKGSRWSDADSKGEGG